MSRAVSQMGSYGVHESLRKGRCQAAPRLSPYLRGELHELRKVGCGGLPFGRISSGRFAEQIELGAEPRSPSDQQ